MQVSTLADIQFGQSVKITDILGSSLRTKLLELGLTQGKLVELAFKAPFGDPIAIDVEGFVLSMRKSEAALIHVAAISIEII